VRPLRLLAVVIVAAAAFAYRHYRLSQVRDPAAQ
jgi:hypothetical protein